MKTNSVPYSDQPPGATPDNTRVANFYQNDRVDNGYDDGYAATGSNYISGLNYLTDVGRCTSSPSYYGTFDQGGNVYEWTEAAGSASSRKKRGGSWASGSTILRAVDRDFELATFQGGDVGFRVATVIPEPSTIVLVCFAAVARFRLLRHRR